MAGLGPLSRRFYQETLPDIAVIITSTHRLASSLFAVIRMLTLSLLWFGLIMLSVLVLYGTIGARFGLTTGGLEIGTAILLTTFLAVPILIYLLNAAEQHARSTRTCRAR